MNHSNKTYQPAELLDLGPPHDSEAERAVLGIALLAPANFAEALAVLSAADFFNHICRTIYAAMLRLHQAGKPIDGTLLIGELRDHGELAVDHRGVMYADVAELVTDFFVHQHLPWYIARVAEMSRRRRAYFRGIRLVQAAQGGDSNSAFVPPAIRRATAQAVARRSRRKAVRR